MFNLYGTERLTEWKNFRDSLESSQTPYQDVARFWSQAPFVSPYLNPKEPSEWPDPWHLILDGKFDDLAIALGMLYTLKLTQRFIGTKCEIHMSMLPSEKESRYFLVIDDQHVLNFEYANAVGKEVLENIKTNLLWSK